MQLIYLLKCKSPSLRVENLAQTTFSISPIRYCYYAECFGTFKMNSSINQSLKKEVLKNYQKIQNCEIFNRINFNPEFV